jgi:hypothetical protein
MVDFHGMEEVVSSVLEALTKLRFWAVDTRRQEKRGGDFTRLSPGISGALGSLMQGCRFAPGQRE